MEPHWDSETITMSNSKAGPILANACIDAAGAFLGVCFSSLLFSSSLDFMSSCKRTLKGLASSCDFSDEGAARGRSKVMEQYPSAAILARYKRLDGKFITLGSAAHNPAEVGADFERALELTNRIGLRPALFTTGKIHPLPPHGRG